LEDMERKKLSIAARWRGPLLISLTIIFFLIAGKDSDWIILTFIIVLFVEGIFLSWLTYSQHLSVHSSTIHKNQKPTTKRRKYPIEYKQRIVKEYDISTTKEQRRSLAEREGISLSNFSSYISRWRQQITEKDEELAILHQEITQQVDNPPRSILTKDREPHKSISEDNRENDRNKNEYNMSPVSSKEQHKKRVCPACNAVVSPTNDSCAICGTYLGVKVNTSRSEDEINSDHD